MASIKKDVVVYSVEGCTLIKENEKFGVVLEYGLNVVQ